METTGFGIRGGKWQGCAAPISCFGLEIARIGGKIAEFATLGLHRDGGLGNFRVPNYGKEKLDRSQRAQKKNGREIQ